jgi:2-polyprenyl-3-methyl-5-hydroxy-6-metoxy-1,4-benzoquinol methylase
MVHVDQANDYDRFAELYSAEAENNITNAYYTLPAMVALAGDVAGRRILDAGCGAGLLAARLRDRGAGGRVRLQRRDGGPGSQAPRRRRRPARGRPG